MKRLFLLGLLALLGSVLLVALIEYDPGYVLISYGLYSVETSVWIALGLLAAVLLLLYLLVSLLRRVLRNSSRLGHWFSSRGQRRSHLQTTQGVIAYAEGNWAAAQKTLSKAARHSDTPLVNYLLAARASFELGDTLQTQQLLQRAKSSAADADVAVELLQAEMQIRAGRLEESLATLTRIRRNSAKHPYVLRLLKTVYSELADWQGLVDILPELEKFRLVEKTELAALEQQAYCLMLQEAARASQAASALEQAWGRVPRHLLRDQRLLSVYVKLLIKAGDEAGAEALLRKQLKQQWQSELVDLYGRVAGADVAKQLLQAESWLKERNNDARLLLALGRLALRNQLWGKAREYFETSLKLDSSAEVCAELARLLAGLGEHEKSNRYFQQGLQLFNHALPALPLPQKA